MAETDRRARGALWWLKLLVLVAAALAIAWVALRVTAVRAFPPQLGVGQRLDPGNPQLLYRQAGQALIQNRGRLPEDYDARLAEAAKRDPLAAEPFLFMGMRALERQDIAGAERLLGEARRRDPRQPLARLALLGTYLQSNRIEEASSEIAAVVRLVPRSSELLVPELARLAAQPQTADAVVAAVGDDPLMAAVLTRLAQQGASPEHLLRLAARQPRGGAMEATGWQARMLEALVGRGEVRRAHELWARLVGVTGQPPLLHDRRFERRTAPPPFNWVLSSSGGGIAEPAAGGALEIEYYGRESLPLASQLLALSPGRYRLVSRVEGSATGQDSRIEWQIACNPNGPDLATAPLREITYNPRDLNFEFTVPATGCAGQWLRLRGVAAEFPSTQAARISELDIQRVGGGS